MRKLRASHRTELVYAGNARESINEMRQTPLDGGRQAVEMIEVATTPEAELHRHRDAFGNEVVWFQLPDHHEALTVESTAIVRMLSPSDRRAETAVAWSAYDDAPYADAMAEFLLPSALVTWPEAVDYFAQGLEIDPELAPLAWLVALEAAVNRAITYETGSTTVDTPVERVVEARRGVCQDMAHLFIALCRRRGVPARYLSGWLHQAGRELPGESHAWAEAHLPGGEWFEFDPTHPTPDLTDYVRLGIGRDYNDVPPIRGTYVGAPTKSMTVTVEVREIP